MIEAKYYTGVGAQVTPTIILGMMSHVASFLARNGWTLRSGGADGGDKAFEFGCDREKGPKEIYLPWKGFNNNPSELHPRNFPFTESEIEFTQQHHPAWHNCGQAVRKLHQRNVRELIGMEAIHGPTVIPSQMVICWTAGGAVKGGTGQTLRLAEAIGIPIINFGKAQNNQELEIMLNDMEKYADGYTPNTDNK
jgi:hypothetical protein